MNEEQRKKLFDDSLRLLEQWALCGVSERSGEILEEQKQVKTATAFVRSYIEIEKTEY